VRPGGGAGSRPPIQRDPAVLDAYLGDGWDPTAAPSPSAVAGPAASPAAGPLRASGSRRDRA
jgi:hypothetical protein